MALSSLDRRGCKRTHKTDQKGRGDFPGGVVNVSHIIHIMGWVGQSKLINGLIAAAGDALVC